MEHQLTLLEPDFEDGRKILEKVYKGWDMLNSLEKQTFAQCLSNGGWKSSILDFQRKNASCWAALKSKTQEASEKDINFRMSQFALQEESKSEE